MSQVTRPSSRAEIDVQIDEGNISLTSEEVNAAVLLEEKEEASVIGVNGAVNSELDLGRVVSNCAWAGDLLVSVEGGEDSGVA